MTDVVLSGLVKRRSELMGQLVKLQAEVQQHHDDLAALDAVIRQIDPEFPVGNIRPRYLRAPKAAETGSMSRAVLDTLRKAGEPLSAPEIAKRIIAERGLNQADRALYRNMSKRVGMALRYQRTNGMVEEIENDGGVSSWGIVS